MGEVRLRSSGGARGEATCPLCREALAEEAQPDLVLTCSACGTSSHGACLEELGGCPTLGCARRGESLDARLADRFHCRSCAGPLRQPLVRRLCPCGAALHQGGCVERHAEECQSALGLLPPERRPAHAGTEPPGGPPRCAACAALLGAQPEVCGCGARHCPCPGCAAAHRERCAQAPAPARLAPGAFVAPPPPALEVRGAMTRWRARLHRALGAPDPAFLADGPALAIPLLYLVAANADTWCLGQTVALGLVRAGGLLALALLWWAQAVARTRRSRRRARRGPSPSDPR